MKFARCVLGAVMTVSCLGWGASLGRAQLVKLEPPPPVVEHPDRMPGHGFAWVPGYQLWDGHQYHWEHGRWVKPPRPGVLWTPGRWARNREGWLWIPGHWRG